MTLRERLSLPPDSPVRRWLVFLLTCMACGLLMAELSFSPRLDLAEGEVPERDIDAPLSFTYIDSAATGHHQEAAEQKIAPVYEADLTLSKRLENRISQAFDLARRRVAAAKLESGGDLPAEVALTVGQDFARTLDLSLDPNDLGLLVRSGFSVEFEELTLELVNVALRRHIIADRSALPSPPRPIVVVNVLGDTREETTLDNYESIRTPEEARQFLSIYVVERLSDRRNSDAVKVATAIARLAVRPNFTANEALTAERRAVARSAVPDVYASVRRGTRIVRQGEPVTAQQAQMLAALQKQTGQGVGWDGVLLGAALSAILIASANNFARYTIRKFARRQQDLEAMAASVVLVLVGARLVLLARHYGPVVGDISGLALLVPVAGTTMLVRILINSESALVYSVVASMLAGVTMEDSAPLAVWYLVTGVMAAGGVGQARERWAVIRAGLIGGVVGAALLLVYLLLRRDSVGLNGPDLVMLVTLAPVAGFLNAALTLGMVPIFERIGFITDYKLLELASLNHPLLRQLMLRAPGTYHHSVIVGSLSEAACEAIGANALLARVACYFHDIGKGVKPQYFVENQRDTANRHDRLSPEQSAQVIINHVRDGQLLALQYSLPQVIIDNIFMHHGTGIIQYFYSKARELNPDQTIDERLFRYPGPKPDTREAGIIMLADKVEAACRTIKEPTEERIRAMIQQIVNSVMSDGQFENCPLTLKELYQIADTFTNVLLGIYHHRIEYPTTRAISQGKGKLAPMPRQGIITLEIVNPLKQPPLPGTARTTADYEAVESLPQGPNPGPPTANDS